MTVSSLCNQTAQLAVYNTRMYTNIPTPPSPEAISGKSHHNNCRHLSRAILARSVATHPRNYITTGSSIGICRRRHSPAVACSRLGSQHE